MSDLYMPPNFAVGRLHYNNELSVFRYTRTASHQEGEMFFVANIHPHGLKNLLREILHHTKGELCEMLWPQFQKRYVYDTAIPQEIAHQIGDAARFCVYLYGPETEWGETVDLRAYALQNSPFEWIHWLYTGEDMPEVYGPPSSDQ